MRVFVIRIVTLLLLLGVWNIILADEPAAPADSTSNTEEIALPDSTATQNLLDTLIQPVEQLPPLPPPVWMIDSLVYYFARSRHDFDIQQYDLYHRNAAGMLYHEASYYAVTYFETPFRTTVSPFGLPGGQVNVQAGENRLHPYDRVIPPDGRIDFDDIATGDIEAGLLIEGPLSAFASPDGGLAMLYLEPFKIPPEVPKSEFIVERGPFGYANTRARVGRMLSQKLGFTFSTDYRKAEGLDLDADDDAYNVKSHLLYKLHRRWTVDLFGNISRRQGGFPVQPHANGYNFRRLRRDHQYVLSLTGQEFYGGQLTGRFEYQSSKAAYSSYSSSIWRSLKPKYHEFELTYLRSYTRAQYQMSLTLGKEKYDIDQFYYSRDFGNISFSGLIDRFGGRFFFFGRLKKAEQEDMSIEGAGGLAKFFGRSTKVILSSGFLTRWPTVTDRFAPSRSGNIGTGELVSDYVEHGNPDLEAEKKLNVNSAAIFDNSKWRLSASFNAGLLDDVIYYNRIYDEHAAGEVFPDNDNIKFADLNLGIGVDSLGPFFINISATGRTLDSDRYGKQPPYAPRWQLYGQGGIRYYISKYQVHLRLFGDVTYTEKPLSYRLEELETGALITGGLNLNLKDFTFYYMIHNLLDQLHLQPEGYGYTGWFYSWGFNWRFLD